MSKRFRLNYWRFGLATGLLCVGLTVAHAQGFPSPDSVADLADRNAMLAAIYILACVTVASMWFAWKSFSVVQRQAEANQNVAAAVTRLVDQLNTRPCIMVQPQPKNPNLLEVP